MLSLLACWCSYLTQGHNSKAEKKHFELVVQKKICNYEHSLWGPRTRSYSGNTIAIATNPSSQPFHLIKTELLNVISLLKRSHDLVYLVLLLYLLAVTVAGPHNYSYHLSINRYPFTKRIFGQSLINYAQIPPLRYFQIILRLCLDIHFLLWQPLFSSLFRWYFCLHVLTVKWSPPSLPFHTQCSWPNEVLRHPDLPDLGGEESNAGSLPLTMALLSLWPTMVDFVLLPIPLIRLSSWTIIFSSFEHPYFAFQL